MKTQYGRTLVEILGALALIGALTFIGIESYKILYAKHQANEAFESVQCQMLELDLLDLDRIDLDEDITSDACENDSGVEIKVVRTEMEDEDDGEISNGYYVELTDLTPEACRQVLSKPWETEFEIAVGCEGRTFNPDEPDYSVCDIFDEDYEPECLEEYIEEYIEEDIGEVSLLDNALPSDSIFHKIIGISNAYAAALGRKDGKYIRIYYQRYVPMARCSGEEMVFGDLKKYGQTVSFCCLGKDKRYYNGTNYACCSTDFDVFPVREGVTAKVDGKDVLVQDCCYSDAIYDIYDTTGAPSGTKYCCEDFVLMDNSDVQVEDIKPDSNLLTADDVYAEYKEAAVFLSATTDMSEGKVPDEHQRIFNEVWQKTIEDYQVPMTLPILGKEMPTEVRLVNCDEGKAGFNDTNNAPHAVFLCATTYNFKKFLERYHDKKDLTPDIFYFLRLYLHERGHGLDGLKTRFKPDGTNISSGIRIMISEVRSRLIEYKFAYDFFKVDDKGNPTKNEKFWEAAVTNKYSSFSDDGWQHFFPKLKNGLREALNETARYLFDSYIATEPNYGRRARRSFGKRTRNLDLDSFISRFPDDDVLSHKDLKDIFLTSQTFWAWVCTEYADLNLIQCMQQQDAKRACGEGFQCCDKQTENLFCAKWEDDKKLKCADGYCTCCPIGESVYWKNENEFGCCENGNIRQIPGKEAGLMECCPIDTSTAYEGQLLKDTDGCRCPIGFPIWDPEKKTCNACTTDNWDEYYCSCSEQKVKNLGGSDLISKRILSPDETTGHYVWADGPTCVLAECIGKSYCFTSQDECCPCGVDDEGCNTCEVGEYDLNADTGEEKACYSCPKNTYWSGKTNAENEDYAERRYSQEEVCTPCPGGMETDAERSIGFESCHCPADKPVWDGTQCVSCPTGTEWITTTKGEEEKRGYDWKTSSNGYACHCPTANPLWDEDKQKCAACPDGTEWITTTKGKDERRGYVGVTYSNDSACHCPAANPVWDRDNKQCTRCPDGTEWITTTKGKEEKRDYDWKTSSNGYACYCPADKPFRDGYNKQCTVCPTGTEWITDEEGEKEKRGYVAGTSSNGYACYYCSAAKPVWDKDEQKCVPCPTGTEWITMTKGKDERRGYVGVTYSYSNDSACHCPAANPVWDRDNKQCTRCPDGTEWMALEEGEKEKMGYLAGTSSNGYACHYCPAANPVWDRDNKQCTRCPDGTDWMSLEEGKGKGKEYVADTYSNGYACHYCPTANPLWDEDKQKCVPCPDGTEWITTTKGKDERRGYVGVTYSYSNDSACHCPAANPVWDRDNKQCTRCPDGTEWITTTKGEEEKRGYDWKTSSNGYACHCPDANPVWHNKQCTVCPDGTEWITEEEGEGRGCDENTYSNGFACYCPPENPVWYEDKDNPRCVSCPDGTEWITEEEGEGRGCDENTYSNGYACHCPADKPVWDRDEKQCTVCPTGTEWITDEEGEKEKRGYVGDTNSLNGYACHCPADKPFWNKTMRQCVDCEEGQISDGMGNCCDPETGTEDSCGCTYETIAARRNAGCVLGYSAYEECVWVDTSATHWTPELVKEGWKENGLIDFVTEGSDGQLRPTLPYDDYDTGTCTPFTTWTICDGPEWGPGNVAYPSCICGYPYQTGEDDGSSWQGRSCNLCPKGTIPTDEPASHYKEANIDPWPTGYFYDPFKGPYCVKCSSTSVWVPGKGTEDDWSYWNDAQCVSCPTGMIAAEACDSRYDDCCRCPFENAHYISEEGAESWGLEGAGCYCPSGTYLDAGTNSCQPCLGEREYMDVYNRDAVCKTCDIYNTEGYGMEHYLPYAYREEGREISEDGYEFKTGHKKCISCYEHQVYNLGLGRDENGVLSTTSAAFIPVIWNGESCVTCSEAYGSSGWNVYNRYTNDCVSCHDAGLKDHWNGSECVACADDPNSGGVVWDNERWNEQTQTQGACVSCYDAYGAEYPVWNWSSYSCDFCSRDSVWDNELKTCVTEEEVSQDDCPEGYAWNPGVECCWDFGMDSCVCDCGSGIWDGSCCGSANDNGGWAE